jgi:transcriptional regulator NrdR family protein
MKGGAINMVKVIKKNGEEEKFSPVKLKRSIQDAAEDANLPPTETKKLVKEVSEPVITEAKKEDRIRTKDIRNAILRLLDKSAKTVSKAWRAFEKKKK